MGLNNLWHVLDGAVRNRVYCALWSQLNDPLEGHYEFYFRSKDDPNRTKIENALKENRDRHRIASFSADSSNFLLWSHYADGHKGIALEVEIDSEEPTLTEILYSDFSCIFTEDTDVTLNHPHVFHSKTPEWGYEKEWRIVTTEEYFSLKTPCSRILLGPRISADRKKTLECILPETVELIETEINSSTGRIEPCKPV